MRGRWLKKCKRGASKDAGENQLLDIQPVGKRKE
jgi:hypothetical protein